MRPFMLKISNGIPSIEKISHRDKTDANRLQKIAIPARRYASFSFEAHCLSLSAHL